jgi:hypothetical protein
MTKLRLKVREIRPTNGAVVLVTAVVKQTFDQKAKTLLAKGSKPGSKFVSKPAIVSPVQMYPTGQLIFIPSKDDKTKYAIDQVYELELKKV